MDKRLTPARIALLYATFSALWIFVSDNLLALLVTDASLLVRISTFKGFAYVLITTYLLYLLVKALATQPPNADITGDTEASTHGIRNLIALFVGLALIVPLFGFGIAKFYSPRIQQAAFDDLSSVAELKSGQIESWLREWSDSAIELSERDGFINKAEQWLKDKDADAKSYLLGRMRDLDNMHGYEPVLLRTDGTPALALDMSPDPVSEKVWRKMISSALLNDEPQHSGLYRDSHGKIRLDYIVPLRKTGSKHAIGVAVLRAPVNSFLFPLIQSWPTASHSAETVLVQRDGNQILFLNELRHQKNTALTLRLPLDRPGLPAATSILRESPQTLQGIDYRDVPVLAATRPIHGTDWHLVAKVDVDEVMALPRQLLNWLTLVAILIIMVVGGAVLLIWRQQQRVHRMEMVAHSAEQDRQLKFFYDLPFLGMAVTSPTTKKWLYVNDRLCEMLGYTHAELLQTTWSDVTHPDDLAGNLEEFERMLAGETEGFKLEKRFMRRDGSVILANVDVKCSRDANGVPIRTYAIVEDITERKRAERALQESEQRLKDAQRNAHLGYYDIDIATGKIVWSEELFRIFGLEASTFQPTIENYDELLYDADVEKVFNTFVECVRERKPFELSYRIVNSRGEIRHALSKANVKTDADGNVVRMFGTLQDITDLKQAETSLRESEATYRSLFENMINGIAHCRMIFEDGRPVDYEFISVNPGWYRITGLKDVVGKKISEVVPGYCEHNPESLEMFGRVAQSGEPAHWEHHLKELDKWFTFAIYSPSPGEFVVVTDDISGSKKADEILRQSATVFESSHDGITITDTNGNMLAVNNAFLKITGYSREEVLGKNPSMLHSGRQSKDFYQSMWASIKQAGYWQGEIWNRRKDGEIYPEWLTISAVKDEQGQTTQYVGTFSDLSRLRQSEKQLEHLAHFDPLTDLPNRLLVLSHLNQALNKAQRHRHQVGVLYIDLDRFKNVNESLGYPVGDELLVALSERFAMHKRSDDVLARISGDEFLLVLDHIDKPEDAAIVARSLRELLMQPFVIDKQEIYVGASIGISLFPGDGNTADLLIQHADAAMHHAKAQGRNTFGFYTDEMTRASSERLDMESRLRHAITADQLRVYFQPQVDIATGHIIGAEALVRWQDPERGLIPPAQFIPLAEETGLIASIGEWVLRETCQQGERWIEAGLPFLTLAVNLSPHQFRRGNIAEIVSKVLAETGFPAGHLELELTESALMEQEEAAVKMLHLLRAQDIRLAIDDFGTGYSSLAYLKRFPLDTLKIDKSFVDDIPFHKDDMEIAATIIAMAHILGFKVLAEGVETAEQLNFLKEKGCDMYQGYLTSPPLPAKEFEKLLKAK